MNARFCSKLQLWVGAAFVRLILFLCVFAPLTGWGHGSVGDPVSRVYRIFLENPQSPDRPVSTDAIAVAGTQPFYDWSEVNRVVPDYSSHSLEPYKALIPDGTIAGAGREKYAGLNLLRDDWPATSVNAGIYPVVFDAHVPHDPSFFRAFISPNGWDPKQPLRWDDLEELGGPEQFIRDGSLYRFNVEFPNRTGHHVLLVIWQRIDPAGEVFFSVSDIDFGDGSGYGNPDNGSGVYEFFPDNYIDEEIDAAVSLEVQNEWGTGYTAEFLIQNHSTSPINGWTLEFDLEADISHFWNAQLIRREGKRYTVLHDTWNQSIPGGQSTSFGFQASPGNFSLSQLGTIQLNGITLGEPNNEGSEKSEPTLPYISVSHTQVTEGDESFNDHCIQLLLSEPAEEMVHVMISSANGSALAGEDFNELSSMVRFPAGSTEATICVSILGDTVWETEESFELLLSNASGASVVQEKVTVTILDNDPLVDPVPEPEPEDTDYDWEIKDNWGSGYVAEFTIHNRTDTVISSWSVSFDLNVPIVNYWNTSNATLNGSTHTFHNASWNGSIPPGHFVTFGLQAGSSSDLEPRNIIINGKSISVNNEKPEPEPETEQEHEPEQTVFGDLEIFIIHAWDGGFTAEASIHIEDSLEGWQMRFDFPYFITDIWDAVIISQNNNRITVGDAGYNSNIASGGELKFGFNGTGQGLSSLQLIHPENVLISNSLPMEDEENDQQDTEGGIEPPEPAIPGDGKDQIASFNYAEAMQKSLYFYDAQRSGDLPDDFRVRWRGDSALTDGQDVGLDLSGGFYDAGDHVKFGLPGAFAFTMLGWSAVDQKDSWVETGQYDELLEIIRWETDYILKAHVRDSEGETLEFYGQVGNGGADHGFWGPPEVMTMFRPSYKVTRNQPGSDLAAESAATLAVASIAMGDSDPSYAANLLENAKALFEFADIYRGFYMNAINDAYGYYPSSHYHDELAWGALWLHRATGDISYLEKAENIFSSQLESGFQSEQPSIGYPWTLVWDDKKYGVVVLLAALTGKEKYKEYAEKWFNFWGEGYNGQRVPRSPGGQAFLNEWGSLRYSSNTAFLALWYADQVRDTENEIFNFGISQINYALGENPAGRSYVIGFGIDAPKNPHHRAAHGSLTNNIYHPVDTQHVLYGALVGGPGAPDDVSYEDRRDDYRSNEVALDYNAGYTAALAILYERFGGRTIQNFPPGN